MPKTDALAVCERLKADRPVTVLIAAEFLDDATSAGFARVKADDLVFKPFSIAEIVDKVAWYLNPDD
jgi:DNA-binding response OmpR family regulator